MFVTRDAQHVVVPWRADLAALIPHARRLAHQGTDMLLIPNRHDEAKLCRNLGVPVPSPILTRYHWAASDGRAPWDIQRTTAALLSESPRAYVLSTMGTGKTRAALFAADWLAQTAGARRWLIAAPLSTLTPVWEQELFRMFPQRRVVVLYGDRAKRSKLLAEDADYYVVNHHGLILLAKELIERRFDGVIYDELAVVRTKSTQLWKASNAIINPTTNIPRWVWGLTGSPTPNAPTDAWGQIRLLTPARVERTMTSFKDRTMRQISSFKWVLRPEANQIVFEAMQPSVRFTRDDVMELPETSYVDRQVKLDGDTAKAYKMLFDKMRVITNAGESITAVNEGVLQSKLLQVAMGYVYTDKGTTYALSGTARLDALAEIVDECDRKIIVFVPFIHALEGVAAFLHKQGHIVSTISGDTARGARDNTFRRFQDEQDPLRVLIAHPQTMAHGLTLTSANTIVWFGPINSLEIYEQANARITRPGQTSKTFIVHLGGSPVEKLAYARLRNKSKMQGLLLDLFKQQELEF